MNSEFYTGQYSVAWSYNLVRGFCRRPRYTNLFAPKNTSVDETSRHSCVTVFRLLARKTRTGETKNWTCAISVRATRLSDSVSWLTPALAQVPRINEFSRLVIALSPQMKILFGVFLTQPRCLVNFRAPPSLVSLSDSKLFRCNVLDLVVLSGWR